MFFFFSKQAVPTCSSDKFNVIAALQTLLNVTDEKEAAGTKQKEKKKRKAWHQLNKCVCPDVCMMSQTETADQSVQLITLPPSWLLLATFKRISRKVDGLKRGRKGGKSPQGEERDERVHAKPWLVWWSRKILLSVRVMGCVFTCLLATPPVRPPQQLHTVYFGLLNQLAKNNLIRQSGSTLHCQVFTLFNKKVLVVYMKSFKWPYLICTAITHIQVNRDAKKKAKSGISASK